VVHVCVLYESQNLIIHVINKLTTNVLSVCDPVVAFVDEVCSN